MKNEKFLSALINMFGGIAWAVSGWMWADAGNYKIAVLCLFMGIIHSWRLSDLCG